MNNNVLNIQTLPDFLAAMKNRFFDYIKDKRFFRITSTPIDFANVDIDVQKPAVVDLLRKPPITRKNGWTLEVTGDFVLALEGIENNNYDWRHITLLKNGHLEFWTGVTESFCWMQNKQEMLRHPRLYPYAVIEYPANFLRLLKGLIHSCSINSDLWITAGYYNCIGCYMRPGHPRSIMFQDPTLSEPYYWPDSRPIEIRERSVPNSFDPDTLTYDVVAEFYSAFGIGRDEIPFFDKDHKLDIGK